MLDITDLGDDQLKKIRADRWSQSQSIWSTLKETYKKNKRQWTNNPDWLERIPSNKSQVRDNRIFLSTETVLNNLTGKPSKPNVVPANETADAKNISESMQKFFLKKYEDLNVKTHMMRGLRNLMLSRLFCIKVYWDFEMDDFNVKAVDPRKVRFGKNSTKEKESEFAIEEINTQLNDVLKRFPKDEIQDKILKAAKVDSREKAYEKNKDVTYYEMWIGNGVVFQLNNTIFHKEKNPFWDWDGLMLKEEEIEKIKESNGKRRRDIMRKFKDKQGEREHIKEMREASKEEGFFNEDVFQEQFGDEALEEYESFLYNHFDKPRKPYIFGSVFLVEDQPIGETSLIEQATPLQEGVDKRKRQIAHNAEQVNGITKVDTEITNMTVKDARKIQYDPSGLIIGDGVSQGVQRETGQGLPPVVFNDMEHSIRELDNIFGTGATFRGERQGGETATGRAILRERGFARLSELVDLVDEVHKELYNWWFQLMKVKYTESHYVKYVGEDDSQEIIEVLQDDLQDGIEVKVVPGNVFPEDELFKAERALEAAQAGFLDPLSYFEEAGFENPEEMAKRLIMFQANPFSIVELEDDELAELARAQQIIQGNIQQAEEEGRAVGQEEGRQTGQREAKVNQLRQRIQQFTESEAFQQMTEEEQKQAVQALRDRVQQLTGTNPQQ